jgi:hypothetical protein
MSHSAFPLPLSAPARATVFRLRLAHGMLLFGSFCLFGAVDAQAPTSTDGIVIQSTPAHERVRAAVLRGERPSLASLLLQVEQDYPGRVLEIEEERFRGREAYEIEILQAGGVVIELLIDAASGEYLEVEIEDEDD